MYGDDWDYANSRLAGTVVRLDGEPVFVHSINPGMVGVLAKLNDLYNSFEADAKALDLVPVPLGMCNFREQAHYLSRVPLRRDWKQGLRKENFHSETVHVQLIPPEILRAVIVGEYPTLEECFAMMAKKKIKSAAWHRHWAITSENELLYKNEGCVGIVEGKELILDGAYRYLQEALREVA